MAYQAPIFQGGDHSADVARYTAAGYDSLGSGLAKGIEGLFENRDKLKEAKLREKTSMSLFESFAKEDPAIAQHADEFFNAPGDMKAMYLSELMKFRTGQQQTAEGARRFDLGHGLATARAGNEAAYQEAQVQNMNADNVMRANRDAYDRQPDYQEPLYKQLPDGTTVVGAQGTKSGTRIFNFLPPREQGPPGPGELVRAQGPARVTSYGYAHDPTPDSNSSAGIGAFVPDTEAAKIRAGQPSPYRLREGDLAFSPDVERQLRAIGVQPGEEVAVQFENGQSHIGRFMDRTSNKLTGRVDFYSPGGVRPDDGTRVTGFARIGPGPQQGQQPAARGPNLEEFQDPSDETGARKIKMQWDPESRTWVPAPVKAATAPPPPATTSARRWR